MPALAARGVELDWSERGQGPATLLVHETGADSAAWEPVAAALAPTRAILYDRRGWGRSTAPDAYRRTTIEEQSEDAAALLEAIDAGPAVLCGAGIGAVIALDLLLRRPHLVSGAVLVEPPLLALVPEATEALSSDLEALATESSRGRDALVELYLSGSLGALGGGAERLPPELAAAGRERPATLVAELGVVTAWATPLSRLDQAQRPTLIVCAESTPPLVGMAAAALADRLEPAELRMVPAAGRAPHLGAHGAVAEAVRDLAAR